MAYQSLYRRYRPQRFAEVRGQEHLVRALQNAVREDRIGHAYLLSGPRGTGKTSTARILAKVLNCENVIDGEPCGVCASCVAIEQSTSFDVHELDAASNNGVEAIRELINKAALGTPGRTKVYILDEVHMLSTPASNALLKTLEEPPDHVVFVLATTDPQKVLPTIRSRCQHYEVHLLPAKDLESLVDDIVADAGLELSLEGRAHVLRLGAGSARDTLSALDQVVAGGGVPDDTDALDELVEALCERDTGRALTAIEAAMSAGRSPRLLGELLIGRLRDVFLSAVGVELDRLSDADRARAAAQAERLGAAGATRALEVLGEAFVGIQDAPDQRIPLETALVRLTRADADLSLAALIDRIGRLERGLADGSVTAAPAPAPPTDSAPASASAPAPAAAPAPSPPVAAAAAPAASAPPAPAPAPPAPPPAAAPAPVPASSGSRPADVARQALADRKGNPGVAKKTPPPRADAAGPPSSVASAPSANPPPAASAPAASDTAPTAAAAPEPASVPATASAPDAGSTPSAAPAPAAPSVPAAGAFPTLDQLSRAWADDLFGSLPGKARSLARPGRWLAVEDGRAVFGLPNAFHVDKSEGVRSVLEDVLQKRFGVAVPITFTVDADSPQGGSDRTTPSSSGRRAEPEPEPEEDIDVSQLVDASNVASSSVDRIAEVFPGAKLVEEDSP